MRDFDGGFGKIVGWGKGAPHAPSHYGKPCMYIMLPEYARELYFYKLHIEN